jgi:hypothetical protein
MAPRKSKKQEPHFEFFGPYLGPAGIVLGLPAVCYALVYACNQGGCLTLSPFSVPGWPQGQRFFTWEASAVFLGWMALQAGLHLLLPGQRVEGAALSDGSKLTYKLNGEARLRALSLQTRCVSPWHDRSSLRRNTAPLQGCAATWRLWRRWATLAFTAARWTCRGPTTTTSPCSPPR